MLTMFLLFYLLSPAFLSTMLYSLLVRIPQAAILSEGDIPPHNSYRNSREIHELHQRHWLQESKKNIITSPLLSHLICSMICSQIHLWQVFTESLFYSQSFLLQGTEKGELQALPTRTHSPVKEARLTYKSRLEFKVTWVFPLVCRSSWRRIFICAKLTPSLRKSP